VTDERDVIVVGGGVIGLAVAWRATRHGLRAIVVDDAPGRGASWASAGMLAPATEVHYGEEALLQLNLAAARAWPAFVAELEAASGHEVGYRECGTVAVARDRDDLAALADHYRYQRELGLRVERVPGRELRRLEPGLAPGVRGGLVVDGDHQVDNRALVEGLLAACRAAGVGWRATRAVAIEPGPSVRLTDGTRLSGEQVVLCAGCWTSSIEGLSPEAVPPVRPVKGQLLHLRGPASPELIARNVRGVEAYLVPRADGRVIVGATVEEQGFDRRATAGAVFELLRAAYELVPGITELELTEIAVGLRPGSPDNAPVIGAAEPGVVVATGHYRNGILLAPLTGDAVASILVTGTAPDVVAPFDPGRFRRARPTAASASAPGGRR
jgi:glycine oxidase